MSKTIAFIGVRSRDIIFYTASLLRMSEKKILIVRFNKDDKEVNTKDNKKENTDDNINENTKVNIINNTKENNISYEEQLVYLQGMDWLTCTYRWYCANKDIESIYDYVLIEIGEEVLKELYINLSVDYKVFIANGYSKTMESVSEYIIDQKKPCILIIRDICNKRFAAKYFANKYPECVKRCQICEIWLDSYDIYYDQCMDHDRWIPLKKLSKDMCSALHRIMFMVEGMPEKQIKKYKKFLLRGEVL